jgi:hypothetical protein
MKFGFRIPSLTKRSAARTSLKRVIRHNLGIKAPRGIGWITDPKKALYNKVYNKTSRGCMVSIVFMLSMPIAMAYGVLLFVFNKHFSSILTNIFEKQVIIKPKIINKFELHLGFNL